RGNASTTTLTGRAALALLLLAVGAGCATTSSTPAPTSAAPPVASAAAGGLPTPTREVLPNGVVLVVQEHRASDVVALQLWMRVGGRDETADELGLSHYLEHMLFKGTPTRPPGSIDALIEGLGGTSNAFTSQDYTHFDVVLPAQHMRAGIELLADIAVNASFEQRELDAERKVVFEEMRLTEDNPDRFMVRRLYEVGYAPHPYGRPPLGTAQLIGALTRDRLNAYYKKFYVPGDMVLVAVGAVKSADVRDAVVATFGRLSGSPPPRPPSASPPTLAGGRRDDIRRSEQQAYLGLGWRTAATNEPDVYAVDL